MHAHGAASWRYDTSTYRAGLRRARPGDARRLADDRVPLSTPLTQAMFNAGAAVYEEDVLAQLEGDLLPQPAPSAAA